MKSKRKIKLKNTTYEVGSHTIHALISEKAMFKQKPAIILVHGIISASYMSPVGEYLASFFNVYNIDLPGFGESTKPAKAYSLERHAAVIAQFVKQLRLKKPVLLGNSYGCQVIIRFAARYPDLLSKAILAGPTVDKYARSPFSQMKAYVQDTLREPEWQRKLALKEYIKAGVGRIAATVRDSLRDQPEKYLPKIKAPVLVVRGEHDPFVSREWAFAVLRLLPDGTYREIPGKGHTVNSNAPSQLANLVTDFVLH